MGSNTCTMQLYTSIFTVGCVLALDEETGRFLTYVPPSPNVWTLIGACTGGRCPGTEGGTLKSANYPGNYPDKTDTTYILETEKGSTIQLLFEEISVEDTENDGCRHDYVKVIDSDGITELARLCGYITRPQRLKSQGNKMILEFYTDESVNNRGFQANWKRVKNPTLGEFKSPNYPQNYPSNQRIEQILEAPKGTRIEITIRDFHTERCCDGLTVLDSDGSLLRRYRGKIKPAQLPIILTSISEKMVLVFSS